MNNLAVEEHNKTLVVDSRLVAQELGVKHGDWLRNILIKYQQEIEADFGVIRFQNGKPLKGSRGGRPEQYAYLTEEQATVLMTYSRNTEQVRNCKRKLVKAFIKARNLALSIRDEDSFVLPPAKEQLEVVKLGMELLTQLGGWDERTNILLKDRVRNILLDNELQPTLKLATAEHKRLEYPVSDRAITLGYKPSNSQLQQIGKRASRLYQEKHGSKPPQREQFVGGTTRLVNVYGHENLELLDEAIATVMNKQPQKKT